MRRLVDLMSYQVGGKLKGLDNDLIGFYNELYKIFPNVNITSGRRYGNGVGKLGNRSRHNVGQAVDIAPDSKIGEFLKSNNGKILLSKYNLGFLDETNPETMKKTGATGAHFHIGKDSTLVGKNNNIVKTESQVTYPNVELIDYSQSQFDNYMSQVIGNNMRYDFSTLPDELKQNITDNIKLQEEMQKQQTEAQRVEQENLALQKALEQKQQEKEQILNMIPKATFVETERTNNYINLLNQQASQNYYG